MTSIRFLINSKPIPNCNLPKPETFNLHNSHCFLHKYSKLYFRNKQKAMSLLENTKPIIVTHLLNILWYGTTRINYNYKRILIKILKLAKQIDIQKLTYEPNYNLICRSYKECFELLSIWTDIKLLHKDAKKYTYDHSFHKLLEFNEEIKNKIINCDIPMIINYLREPSIDDFIVFLSVNTDKSIRNFILNFTNTIIIEKHRNPTLHLEVKVTKNRESYVNLFDFLQDNDIKLSSTTLRDLLYILEIKNNSEKQNVSWNIIFVLLLSQPCVVIEYLKDLVSQTINHELKINNMIPILSNEMLMNLLTQENSEDCNSILRNIYIANKELFIAIVLTYYNNDFDLKEITDCFKSWNYFTCYLRTDNNIKIHIKYNQTKQKFEHLNTFKLLYKHYKFNLNNIVVKCTNDVFEDDTNTINYVQELEKLLQE